MQHQAELHTNTNTNSKIINMPLGAACLQNPAVKEITRSRSQVLRYLLKLKRAVDARHHDLIDTLTRRFVETVTDYVSYGHFRLMPTFDASGHLVAAMDQNTKAILSFTDNYQGGSNCDLNRLIGDLESVAWQIEARFDIEDEMVYH